jgi:hypothetical protein
VQYMLEGKSSDGDNLASWHTRIKKRLK